MLQQGRTSLGILDIQFDDLSAAAHSKRLKLEPVREPLPGPDPVCSNSVLEMRDCTSICLYSISLRPGLPAKYSQGSGCGVDEGQWFPSERIEPEITLATRSDQTVISTTCAREIGKITREGIAGNSVNEMQESVVTEDGDALA
jgi:hypothetical protein